MTTIAKDIAVKFGVAVAAIALALSAYAPAAQAQTTDELQQMINDLLAQVAQLQGQVGQGAAEVASGVCPYTWTRDLSQGSTGADVMKLQQFLNADPDTRVAVEGAGSVGMETEYYGPATAAAVSKMQVKYRSQVLSPAGLVNPTGYFGPSSRSAANGLCVAAPVDDMDDDEMDDEDEMEDEDEDEDEDDGDLRGEGVLETFEIDDEETEVQEGAEDEVVMAVTAEAQDGDVELSRLTMQLFADSGNEELDPWDVFDEVSLWVDGDKVADFDASDEDEYLDEDDGTFRFSNLDLILREDDEVEMLVAVSVQNSVDGSDANAAEWNLDIYQGRYFDADGVATTESIDEMGSFDASTVAFSTVDDEGVTFDIVVEGVDDDADVEANSSSPDSATLLVDDGTSDSDEYTVHIFDIEVDEDSSDLELDDAYVWVTVTNASSGAAVAASDIIEDIFLTIDGQTETGDPVDLNGDNDDTDLNVGGTNDEFDALVTNGTPNRIGFVFEFDGLELEADETYEAEVSMTFKGTDGGMDYLAGATIQTDVDAQETGALWQVEGLDSDNVLTGTDQGEVHTLDTVVPIISDTSFSNDRNEAGDSGVISFEFTLEADEDDYEFDSSTDVVYSVVGPTGQTATVTGTVSAIAGEYTGADPWTIQDGDDATFVLDVSITPADAGDNGAYRVYVDTIAGQEIDDTSDSMNLTFIP